MAIATYVGVVQEGRIRLEERVTLPEGSRVYVVVPTLVDERTARRKANRWLAEWVGDMVMADRAEQVQLPDGRPVWRFGAFITSLAHNPIGPIGHVDVEASSGLVLTDIQMAQEMIARGECLVPAPSPPER